MVVYNWSEEKNELLKKTREVSFEQVVVHVEQGDLVDIIQNPNKEKYAHQKVLIVNMNNYVYAVPFVENGNERFLKTIIPSRKLTKRYLGVKK